MALTKKFIEEQKQKLIQKQKDIKEEIDRLKEEDPYMEEAKNLGGRNLDDYEDEVQEDTGHDRVQILIRELSEDLEQVNKALLQIEKGTYGTDEKTGKEISKERLEAYPEATTAID